MEAVMLNLEIRKYVECTNEEKQSCVPVINQLFALALQVREKGIPSLEQRITDTGDYLLMLGLGLLVDNTNTDVVSNILDTAITFSCKTGVDLLAQLIIREGILGISHGYNPKIIEVHLWRYLGSDFVQST
jgi:flagellar motor component MotA